VVEVGELLAVHGVWVSMWNGSRCPPFGFGWAKTPSSAAASL
jgi:hypothetical protein